jgi:uncharacterized protein
MLTLDLARLDREGSVRVDARIPADDPLWSGTAVAFAGPVHVRLRASAAGSGEVVVRGEIEARLAQECRRCLEPVEGRLTQEVTMVFLSSDTPGAEEDGDARVFDSRASELDLSEPVREEVVLAIDPYVVCDPGCKGLCPQCGVNWNVEECNCASEASDPRWDVLRALKEE